MRIMRIEWCTSAGNEIEVTNLEDFFVGVTVDKSEMVGILCPEKARRTAANPHADVKLWVERIRLFVQTQIDLAQDEVEMFEYDLLRVIDHLT